MSNIMEIILKATDQATGTLQKVSAEFDKAAEKPKLIGDNMAKAMEKTGIAMAAAGVGIEALARKQVELATSTDQIAIAYGTTSSVISDMAIAVNGAGDSISETLDTIKLGVQQGLDGEALENYAGYWDTVADAVGGSAPALADAGLALTQLGVDAANMEQETSAAFGYLVTNTTASIDDFLSVVAKTGDSLNTMGVDVNEAAVIIGEMADQGIPAKVIISEINAAAAETGGLEKLCDQYGITTDELFNVTRNADEYSGKLTAQAAAVEANLTPLQKIQTTLEETAYKYRDVIAGAAEFAPVLMAGGAVLAGMPTIVNGYNKAMDLLGTGLKAVGAMAPGTVASLGTIGPAIAGIMIPWGAVALAAIALFAAAWKTNFLGIRDVVAGVKDFLTDRFAAIKDAAAKMGDALAPSFDALKKAGGELKNSLGELFKQLSGGVSATELFSKAWQVVGRVLDAMISIFGKLATAGVKVLVDQLTQLVDWVGKVVDWFTKLADNKVVQYFLDLKEGVESAASTFLDKFIPAGEETNEKLDETKTKTEEVTTGFATLDTEGSASINSLATNVTSATGSANSALDAMNQLIMDTVLNLDAAAVSAGNWNQALMNADAGQLELLLGSGNLSEYDQGLALTQLQNLQGLTPEQQALLDVLTQKKYDGTISMTAPGTGTGSSSTTTVDDSYTIGDNTYDPTPEIEGDWTEDPDYAGFINTGSYSGGTVSPSGQDTSTQQPLYITQQTGANGEVYNQAYYADASQDNAVWGVNISPEDIAQWIGEGVALYEYDPSNYMGGYQGDLITGAVQDQSDAMEDMADQTETLTSTTYDWMDATDSATSALDSAASATDSAASATDGYSSSMFDAVYASSTATDAQNWLSDSLYGTVTAAGTSLTAFDTMGTGMVTGMDSTGSSVLGTFSAMGTGAAQSTGYISDVCSNLFGSIASQAQEALATITGTTTSSSCADGSCGSTTTTTGGAGSPILTDGSSCTGLNCAGILPGSGIYDMGESWTTTSGGFTTSTTTDYSTGTVFGDILSPVISSWYPAMAEGGDVAAGGMALVGERGPEFLNLPAGARVTPLRSGEDDLVEKIAAKILAKIGSARGRSGDVHLHGVFIADKSGLMKLNKEIEKVKVLEDARRGRKVKA